MSNRFAILTLIWDGTWSLKSLKSIMPAEILCVSSRVLIEKEMESQRSEVIKLIEKGQVRKGMVKNITDFGVFVDLGGVDGLTAYYRSQLG